MLIASNPLKENFMKNRCVIIAGSPVFSGFDKLDGDYVIAADSGLTHALAAGVRPDLLIGDFDSLIGTVDDTIKTIKAPVIKDDTDTMLAVKYALANGFSRFLLLGATGGRLDHQTANIAVCAYIAEQSGVCEVRDGTNSIFAIKNSKITLNKKKDWSVSVFSYTDKSEGVSLTGLKYPLENQTLTSTFPIGVSNEFAADKATVEVREGILLIILSDMGKR